MEMENRGTEHHQERCDARFPKHNSGPTALRDANFAKPLPCRWRQKGIQPQTNPTTENDSSVALSLRSHSTASRRSKTIFLKKARRGPGWNPVKLVNKPERYRSIRELTLRAPEPTGLSI